MKLRYRPMRSDDIPECVDIVANHPVIGPRYGPLIGHLAEAWRGLLGLEACTSAVFHSGEDDRRLICAIGFSLIVRDDFVREIKREIRRVPPFWIGPELTKRVISGAAPVLTDKELKEANSLDGLNLLVWEGCITPGYEALKELSRCVMSGFIEMHQGYRWKEIIAPHMETPDRLRFNLNTGGFLWDPIAGIYTDATDKDLDEIVKMPHIVGITRELEQSRRGDWSGSWVGALFEYEAPVLGFSRSEQRLLSAAISGATDEQLAATLEISLPTIKKMWVSIYNRVEDHRPALIAEADDPPVRNGRAMAAGAGFVLGRAGAGLLESGASAGSRGREKRRGLLAYLREHPEELRPIARALLNHAGDGGHPRPVSYEC